MLQSILLLLVGRCAFAIDNRLYSEVLREAVNSEDEDRTAYSGSTKSSGNTSLGLRGDLAVALLRLVGAT